MSSFYHFKNFKPGQYHTPEKTLSLVDYMEFDQARIKKRLEFKQLAEYGARTRKKNREHIAYLRNMSAEHGEALRRIAVVENVKTEYLDVMSSKNQSELGMLRATFVDKEIKRLQELVQVSIRKCNRLLVFAPQLKKIMSKFDHDVWKFGENIEECLDIEHLEMLHIPKKRIEMNIDDKVEALQVEWKEVAIFEKLPQCLEDLKEGLREHEASNTGFGMV